MTTHLVPNLDCSVCICIQRYGTLWRRLQLRVDPLVSGLVAVHTKALTDACSHALGGLLCKQVRRQPLVECWELAVQQELAKDLGLASQEEVLNHLTVPVLVVGLRGQVG